MNRVSPLLLLISCAALATAQQPTPPNSPTIQSAVPAEDINAKFNLKEGWIGGDGAHSLALRDNKTLWLFSDTWIGKINGDKREDATIVNNTLAIQTGSASDPSLEFFIQKDAKGAPTAWITPADGRGWFWLQAGIVVNGHFTIFLTQIEKTSDPGVFGFRQMGQWIGVVENAKGDPLKWTIKQSKLPHTFYSSERETTFGAALLRHGDHVYIYGTDEDVKPKHRDRFLIVARAPAAKLADFGAWEFYADGKWQSDFRKSTRLAKDLASDGSVTYLPDRKQFILVYTQGGLSKKILARAAKNPWGPWSDPTTIYECPEMAKDKRLFCYNAKAHATLSSGNELVVSYVTNSTDFWQVAADASLYWPKFVRVKVAPTTLP
jgi:hypothetical protein